MKHFLIELFRAIHFVVHVLCTLFRHIMNCFSFAALFCVVCQNGWLPWLVKGNVSAGDFQSLFVSVLYIYATICVVKFPFFLSRLDEGGFDN